jgi:DNA-binding transcriptional ArsR family regulator
MDKVTTNKKYEFDEKIRVLAEFAKSISHPARIAILQALAEKRVCVCGEIVDVMPLAQSTVSQHLKELKDSGLVQAKVDGTKSRYCIDWSVLDEFYSSFNQMYKEVSKFRKG